MIINHDSYTTIAAVTDTSTNGLEYCKKGIHHYYPINTNGDLQCIDCGHRFYKNI